MSQDQLSRDSFLQALRHSIDFLRGDRSIRKHLCRGRLLAESGEASERQTAEAHFDTSVSGPFALQHSSWILAPQVACTSATHRTSQSSEWRRAGPFQKIASVGPSPSLTFRVRPLDICKTTTQ